MQKIKYFLLTKSIGLYINLLSYWNAKRATKLAYKLFSSPREGKLIHGNLPPVLQDAVTESVHIGENYFQTYRWEGNEEITLLVHGWESNASRWEKLLPYLKASGQTIIAIDAPAHGLSGGTEFNVPQYAAFIDVLVKKFQPKSIVGHSIGGIASAYYQHHYSNKLEKMVLLGAPSDFGILLSNYVKLLSLNNKIHQSLVAYTKTRFNIEVVDFSGQKFLETATLKGMIVHDPEDSVVAFSEAKKLADTWKSARFIETKGLGHSLHDDELYQEIIRFLKQ